MSYGYLGKQAILASPENLDRLDIPVSFIFAYINRQRIVEVGFIIFRDILSVLLVQCAFAIVYSESKTLKTKRIAALATWAFPAILGLPTVVLTVLYLLSPLYAVGSLSGLISLILNASFYNKEDFIEGLPFILAVVGWFNIFWLCLAIKSWFLSQE